MSKSVLAGGVPSIPEFRPVSARVFAERAERLDDLAGGHAMEQYLRFASSLVRAQAAEVERSSDAAIPDRERVAHCREHGLPPLSVDDPPEPGWRRGLEHLLNALDRGALPAEAASVVAALRDANRATLERDAKNVLAGAYSEVDPARVPFVGAALQLHWAKMALKLGRSGRSPGVDFGLCPVCGSPPVVSVVRSGGAEQGLRYWVCSLCASEWHVVRIKCTSCSSTESISYLFIEGANDAVRAECCDGCKTYLKILYLDKDARMEPVADDLATLALDMLVDERGYRRIGPNLLLSPGGRG